MSEEGGSGDSGSEEFELYNELFYLGIFLGGLWAATWFCRLVNLTPIVGQIIFGILLGPNGFDIAPLFQESDLEYIGEDCVAVGTNRTVFPGEEFGDNYLIVLGQLGVTFLIFESGLHVDFPVLKRVGGPAFMVAVLGTLFSVVFGVGLSALLGFGAYPEGLAIGAVIAPTSVGIALKLLHDANVLDSIFGQTIVTAAFTDDVFSLITLALLLQIAQGDFSVVSVIKPLFSSIAFVSFGFISSLYIFPAVVTPLLHWISVKFGQQNRDNCHMGLLFLFMAAFGIIGSLIGSHLLGAFLTGIAFAKVPRTSIVWDEHMGVVNEWLIMIFFGATVAFSVPVDEMMSVDIFWKGVILGVATIAAKLLCGLLLEHRWVIGWAMVGRGEFSFLVGDIYKQTDFQSTGEPFLSPEGFGVAVWALMIAIFVAPIAFGIVLTAQLEKEKAGDDVAHYTQEEDEKNLQSGNTKTNRSSQQMSRVGSVMFQHRNHLPRSKWVVNVSAEYQEGLAKDILGVFEDLDIMVLNYSYDADPNNLVIADMTFTILMPDPADDQSRTHDHNRFKDNFFNFDIEKFIGRLKFRVLGVINEKGKITFDKIESASQVGGGSRRMMLSSHQSVTPSRPPHASLVEIRNSYDDKQETL